mmetsp:Transcript_18013/g.42396  ORF Transcript_18013/g.42396 Transcript_18013/m.42396 type:complete len:331 (+) Transcript_18013:618-1610(+)
MPGMPDIGTMGGIMGGPITPIPMWRLCIPMACIPICMPMCMPMPSKPVACGHSFVRWSPPHVLQTQAPLPAPMPLSGLLRLTSASSRSLAASLRSSLASCLRRRLSSRGGFGTSSGGVFSIPSGPRAHATSARTSCNACSCCSFWPKILISRSISPGRMSSLFCTLMSAPVFSMTSRTDSPPRPITRPASRSLTHNLKAKGDECLVRWSFSTVPSSSFAKDTSARTSSMARSWASRRPKISRRPEPLSTSIFVPESLSRTLTVSPLRPRTRPTSSGRTSRTCGVSFLPSPFSEARASFNTSPSSSRQKVASCNSKSRAAFCSLRVPTMST